MNRPLFALIAFAVLGAGIGINQYLVKTKPSAKKVEHLNEGVAVEVITVGESSTQVTVRARGTVVPARSVVLGTEVGGKVINISPELQPGGTFLKGDIIARIDPSDYRIAVEQSFAMVDSAQAQLSIEESRRAVAAREWDMFGGKSKSSGNRQLALREPQMRSATTQLKSARSGLKRARLGVERTLLRAPFDGMVQSRNVELGQIVGPGSPLLNFVGTYSYWVQVSLPVERLAWISVPGIAGQKEGSLVTIHHQLGGEHIEKTGRVLRLLGEVDPAGRMARLLIEVDDPLGLVAARVNARKAAVQAAEAARLAKAKKRGKKGQAADLEPLTPLVKTETPQDGSSKLPLLLGTYVEVEIQGRQADKVVELDRVALRRGDTVYVLKDDMTLEKRKVEVLWRRENIVLVSSGIQSGEKLVVSPLSSAFDGMKLRIPDDHSKGSPAKTPKAKTEPGTDAETKPEQPPRGKEASANTGGNAKAGTSL